jgi:hypothetical protein
VEASPSEYLSRELQDVPPGGTTGVSTEIKPQRLPIVARRPVRQESVTKSELF